MTKNIISNLTEIKQLLNRLNNEQYGQHLNVLNGSSIGQHIRHILEFYQCLLVAGRNKSVNYDARQRNMDIETNSKIAADILDEILSEMSKIVCDSPIILLANFSTEENEKPQRIHSTFYRELAYNFEHSIHHQALIKVGLAELKLSHLIAENFGIAPSTIRSLKACAQ